MNTSAKPGSLAAHLVGFVRYLRTKGFLVGVKEQQEVFKVLEKTPFQHVEKFRTILSQLLCKSREQQMMFPQLFDRFWQELFTSFDAKVKPMSKTSAKRTSKPATLSELKGWLYNKRTTHTEEAAFYSRTTGTSSPDLTRFDSGNIKEVLKLVDQIARKWATRPGRRKVPSKSGGQVDLRQVVRRNLGTGEMIDISFRKNKQQKPRLVLVCDVSKSMELFTNFTVKLLYAFQKSYRSIETFVFGTELYKISGMLKEQSFNSALKDLSEQVPDWSGGTRIGHCLDTLIKKYGGRLLHGNVIFLIISDGWDTGDLQLLEASMEHISRRTRKLIWLNPQAGKPGYKPRVQGMLRALPYIDYMHGVHDIQSLRELKSFRI